MLTLGLDTATAEGSVALLNDEDVIGEQGLGHERYAVEVFAAIARVLGAAACTLTSIGLVAVTDGPGSFTGVRIGLTVAKGLAETLRLPVVTASTLRAQAALAGAGAGPVLAALGAGRGEVYYGIYGDGVLEEGLELVALMAERLAEFRGPAVSADTRLQQALPALAPVGPWLAGAMGRLGYKAFREGRTTDALALDARYIRRSDAEMFAGGR
ncbi:MAG: tRNA (adenosine(37)-N6)-threonylcarbamoyltransferase complex dimerization subunit type 1 TsaB [Terriglobales bacterium]